MPEHLVIWTTAADPGFSATSSPPTWNSTHRRIRSLAAARKLASSWKPAQVRKASKKISRP
jgi:hypothetical protein